jgi:AraC-like DNA-binding protein
LTNKTVPHIECFRLVFPDTDPLSGAAYEKMMRPLFAFEIPQFTRDAPFSSTAEIYCLPDVTVSRTKSSACRFSRTIKTIAQSATDQVLVVCYRSGHFDFETGGGKKRAVADELTFFDLSQELVIEAPAVDNISLAISRRRLEALFPVLDHVHGFVLAPNPLTKVLLGVMEDILAIGPAMPLAEARSIADAIIGLVAACLETPLRQQVAANAGNGAVSLVAVKAAIERRLVDSALGPQTLLDEFGITRSTLYRMFEPLGGVSAYITERRLRYAFRRMTDPLEPRLRISQLAFDLGFSHASAFTPAFKGFFGLSPKEVRALTAHPEGRDVPFLVSSEARPYLHPIPVTADKI